MKDKKFQILAAVSLLLLVTVSRYDTAGRFWWINLLIFILGVWVILSDLKPEMNKEIAALKERGSTSDFLCSFLQCAVSVSSLVAMFRVGFTGSFRSEFGMMGETFVECLFTAGLALFACAVMSAALGFLVFVPLGAFLSWLSFRDSQFPFLLFRNGCALLILGYACGIIDAIKIIVTVGDLLDSIFR